MVKKIIGDATLYLGDCLEIIPALDPVDFVFTDPPYGHNNNDGDMIANWEAIYGGKNKVKKVEESEYRPIANDGIEANEIYKQVLPLLEARLSRGGCCCCCCCCGGGGPDPQFARWSIWMDEVFDFKQMVIWDKGPMGMGHHYRRSYETVLVGVKHGGPVKWYDNTRRIENIIRPEACGKIIPQKDDHPTVKPVKLSNIFIGLHSRPGEIVLDPFMGSGTTGISAITMGRKFIGIELDEIHFNHAVQRITDAWKSKPMLFEETQEPIYKENDMFGEK